LRTYCIGSIRIRHPGREGNAGSLTAGDRIELLESDVALDRRHPEVDERAPHARKRDQPPAIGVDRARPAGREDERLVGHEADRLHLDEHLRRQFGDHVLVGKAGHYGLTCSQDFLFRHPEVRA
jgi:hypothetical protein